MDGLDVLNSIVESFTFDALAEGGKDLHRTKDGRYNVVVVDSFDESSSLRVDSWDVGQMGWEGECWLVLQVVDRHSFDSAFFKKFGKVNSYYGAEWTGKFIEVKKVKKEVVVYE